MDTLLAKLKNEPMMLHFGNQSAISIAKVPVHHNRRNM